MELLIDALFLCDVGKHFKHIFELVAIVVLKMLHNLLIERVNHVDGFETFDVQCFHGWRGGDRCDIHTKKKIDAIRAFLHAIHIFIKTGLAIARLQRLVAE